MRKSRCVIVLSIPRSGSSLVAGVLHRLGVDMGEGYLQPPDISNQRGYYEDLRWQKTNKRLVGPRYEMHCLEQIPERIQNKYRKLIAVCETKPLWGMKDPRLCVTLHWITPYLQDARLVIVRRDLGASVRSLVYHSQVSYQGTLEMNDTQARSLLEEWQRIMDWQIATFNGPMLTVNYRDMLNEPMAWVCELNRFARQDLAVQDASDKQLLKAAAFCVPGLNHNSPGVRGRDG